MWPARALARPLRGTRAGALLLAWTLLGAPTGAAIGATVQIVATDRTELSIEVMPAKGRRLALWLPSELGLTRADARIARALAAHHGIEVWLADLHGARFLPPLPSSLNEIPDSDLTRLAAAALTKKPQVVIVTAARGAALALRALKAAPDLRGAVLMSPNLYAGGAEIGEDPPLLPIAAQVAQPLFIIQAQRSPRYFALSRLTDELARGGARVETQVVAQARDRFYFRDDATALERRASAALPATIAKAVANLLGDTP